MYSWLFCCVMTFLSKSSIWEFKNSDRGYLKRSKKITFLLHLHKSSDLLQVSYIERNSVRTVIRVFDPEAAPFPQSYELPLVYQVHVKLCTLTASTGSNVHSEERSNATEENGPKDCCYHTVFNANLSMRVRFHHSCCRKVMLTVFGNKIIITVCISDEMRFNPFELLIVCHTTLKMDATIVSTAQKYEIQSNMHSVSK